MNGLEADYRAQEYSITTAQAWRALDPRVMSGLRRSAIPCHILAILSSVLDAVMKEHGNHLEDFRLDILSLECYCERFSRWYRTFKHPI